MVKLKVSIALCTYNGGKFLREQLDSYLCQTQPPDELVVCDDCSTDDTPAIVSEFAARAPFDVRWIRNEQNLGPARNFEKAIQLCRGDIIFLSDQDDLWVKEKIEKIVAVFNKSPEIGLVFSNASVVDQQLQSMGYTMWDSVKFMPQEQKKVGDPLSFLRVLLRHNVITGATTAFRSEFVRYVCPIDTNDVDGCGHDSWIGLVLAGISYVGCIPENLILYRQHRENLIGGRPRSKLTRIINAFVRKNDVTVGTLNLMLARVEALSEVLLKGANKDRTDRIRELLEGKATHIKNRTKMHTSQGNRASLSARELYAGRYHLYSFGWLSFLRDFLAR